MKKVIEDHNKFLDYRTLADHTPVIGVWDDHDYAANDANGNYPFKEETKKFYLDFLDEPEDSPKRKIGRGIQSTYSFGDPSTHKTFRIILLDVRFYKNNYIFDKVPDMLGEEQWTWLEETLQNANETFIFIGSGTQILPFSRLLTESWYAESRIRLFEIIAKTKKSGVVLLSGDIHCAEILKTFCVHPDIGYNLYEFSSSGLSHYCAWKYIGETFFNKDYGIVPLLDNYNFGKIEFDWGTSKKEAKVTMNIMDIDNKVYFKITLSHEELSYNLNHIKSNLDNPYYRDCKTRLYSRFKSFWEYYYFYKNNIPDLIIMIGFYFLLFTALVTIYKLLKLIFKFLFRPLFKNKAENKPKTE